MIRAFLFFILTLGGTCAVFGHVTNLNRSWAFQRLPKHVQVGEIKNQGTSWESQYNVQHVSEASALRIPDDTLRNEFALLQQGKWEQVNLPHNPVDEPFVIVHQWQGICYYKRTLPPSSEWVGQQLWLEFQGAMQLADVWVNGKHATQHAGGYVPFVVDVTKLLSTSEPNEILVRLDNRDNGLIPPGKPLYTLDFCYYGGLYRDVNLVVKPPFHITHPILANEVAGGGVFVTYPEVSPEKAVVGVKTQIANTGHEVRQGLLRQTLYEIDGLFGKGKKGRKVAVVQREVKLVPGEKQHFQQRIEVKKPRLWGPDAPYLYLLDSEIVENGKTTDREETRVGIRTIEMNQEKGFVINGQPVRLVGANRHMDYPYVGNAISRNAQYRDIWQMKTSGFNVVRLGHYPQDPSVLEACDELGLLAIEPDVPGWQFFNKNPLFTELCYRDIRATIRRDRNHPSIIMWETILNEAWPPVEWKEGAIRTAHEEFPGDQFFASGDTYGYFGYDVCYNDWEEGFHRPNKSSKPGFIREYYDYEFGGHYSTTRIRRGDGEKALLQNAWNAQWSHNRYRTLYPRTTGDAVWSMYDYNRGCADNICYSGLADLFRLPKYSFAFFLSQVPVGTPLPDGAMPGYLFIANRWDSRPSLSDTVVVFGNVEEVALSLNGKEIRRQQADKGPDTDYVPSADGGNCLNLVRPPFTFTGIKWESGTLKATGYIGGKKVAEHSVRTPGEPCRLAVEYFESGRPAARRDLLIVNIRLLDAQGTLCSAQSLPVALAVKGGVLHGPAEYTSEAGIASFLVETGDDKTLELTATTDGNLRATRKIALK